MLKRADFFRNKNTNSKGNDLEVYITNKYLELKKQSASVRETKLQSLLLRTTTGYPNKSGRKISSREQLKLLQSTYHTQ